MNEHTEYKSYECQKCGERIGWIGRFLEWIPFSSARHDCDKYA